MKEKDTTNPKKETKKPETTRTKASAESDKTVKTVKAPAEKRAKDTEASPVKKASLKKGAEGEAAAKKAENQNGRDPKSFAMMIAGYLDEKKARDITILDIAAKTIIADYFVIASAGSATAVRALADYVDEKLSKDQGIEPLRRDADAKWYAVDYGSVILHVFYEETRAFYQLERLWADGDNIIKYP